MLSKWNIYERAFPKFHSARELILLSSKINLINDKKKYNIVEYKKSTTETLNSTMFLFLTKFIFYIHKHV